jgi:post-segregation antitoxin (ccd killing protein)
MRTPPYDTKAAKQTVSLTINSDVYAQAKGFGLNASQIAEDALAREVARRKAEQLKAEILQDLAACDAYSEKHGSFGDFVRDYYDKKQDEE